MKLTDLTPSAIAVLPLVVVGVMNVVFTHLIPRLYGDTATVQLSESVKPILQQVLRMVGIWAVESALVLGIFTVLIFGWKKLKAKFKESTQAAMAGAMSASLNTASAYGYVTVIAALPGFLLIRNGLQHIPDPLANEAISITVLSGTTFVNRGKTDAKNGCGVVVSCRGRVIRSQFCGSIAGEAQADDEERLFALDQDCRIGKCDPRGLLQDLEECLRVTKYAFESRFLVQ